MPKAHQQHKSPKKDGFTLIELMVVLMILALLATAVLPNVISSGERAKAKKAITDIAGIEGMLDQFYIDMQRYPSTDEGLRALYYKPEDELDKWKGPYPKKPIPNDPWDQPYYYESPGSRTAQPYEVWSYGSDMEEGGEGTGADIISWVEEDDGGF